MPDQPRIINFNDARRQREQESLAEILPWMEEIEDALETLTTFGVSSRAELEDLLAELEARTRPDDQP